MQKNKSIIFKAALSLGLLTMLTSGVYADSSNLNNIVGKDRFETSILSSRMVKSDTVVLANGYSYADSLSAINLASSKKAKLILVKNGLNIASELKNQGIKTAYIVGGEKTIGKNIFNQVSEVVSNVKRISGENRYKTNDKTLKESNYKEVGVADGRNFPDALSASGLLINHHIGLLLVDGSKPYKTEYKVDYTFGGKNSVFQDGGKRLEGKNRYETSLKIASEMGVPGSVVVTTGTDFADALSSINLININVNINTPVILVSNQLNDAQKQIISKATERYILGGKVGISIETTIKNIDNNLENKNEENSTNIGKYVPSGSRHHSSRVDNSTAKKNIENPEVNEIINQYVKLYDTLKNKMDDRLLNDKGRLNPFYDINKIYPVDFDYRPNYLDFRDFIKSQKVKSIKNITDDMTPQEQADQFIYNNFYAINTMRRSITPKDKDRIDKAVKEYNSLSSITKEYLNKYPVFDSINLGNVYDEGIKIYRNMFVNGRTLDLLSNDDYRPNMLTSDIFDNETDIYGKNFKNMFRMDDISDSFYENIGLLLKYKKIYCDQLNGIQPNIDKQVDQYNNLYSNLYDLATDKVNYKDANQILYAIYDYRHLEKEAQYKLKDKYKKIVDLSDKLSNLYKGTYSSNPEEYSKEYNYNTYKTIANTINNDTDSLIGFRFNGAFPNENNFGLYDVDNHIKLHDANLNVDTVGDKLTISLKATNYGKNTISFGDDYFRLNDILGYENGVNLSHEDGGPGISTRDIVTGNNTNETPKINVILRKASTISINPGETKSLIYEVKLPKDVVSQVVTGFKFARGVNYAVDYVSEDKINYVPFYLNNSEYMANYVNNDGNFISHDGINIERVSIDNIKLTDLNIPNPETATKFIIKLFEEKDGSFDKLDAENTNQYNLTREYIISKGYFDQKNDSSPVSNLVPSNDSLDLNKNDKLEKNSKEKNGIKHDKTTINSVDKENIKSVDSIKSTNDKK